MNEIGPTPAGTGEPGIGVSVPLALGQAIVTCMHAEKMLMLFDPLLATKRYPGGAATGQSLVVIVAVVVPAQRENARPLGFVPTVMGDVGAGVSVPLMS